MWLYNLNISIVDRALPLGIKIKVCMRKALCVFHVCLVVVLIYLSKRRAPEYRQLQLMTCPR